MCSGLGSPLGPRPMDVPRELRVVVVHSGEKAMVLNQAWMAADSWALPTSRPKHTKAPKDTLVNRLWGLTHTISSMALGWRQGGTERLKGVRERVLGSRCLARSSHDSSQSVCRRGQPPPAAYPLVSQLTCLTSG